MEEGQDGYDPDTFENRIYCDAEIDYNIALCQLMLDRKDVAFKTLRKYESFELVFGPAQAPCGEEAIDLTPFPINNRLCSIFGETEYSNSIRFKLSFCLPKVSPP